MNQCSSLKFFSKKRRKKIINKHSHSRELSLFRAAIIIREIATKIYGKSEEFLFFLFSYKFTFISNAFAVVKLSTVARSTLSKRIIEARFRKFIHTRVQRH